MVCMGDKPLALVYHQYPISSNAQAISAMILLLSRGGEGFFMVYCEIYLAFGWQGDMNVALHIDTDDVALGK